MRKKYFIITVDTEGDNIWEFKPQRRELQVPTTQNALYLFRFQQLCEKYHFYPTNLVDYEMALDAAFKELGKA